jgi:CRISPR-associated endoribonuclease Cas6
MNVTLPDVALWHLRWTLGPREPIRLPRMNKGITLRGAFGTSFRHLVCVDRTARCEECGVHPSCPYGVIFAPRVPEEAVRLRLNKDIPRPFVVKPPLDDKEIYRRGEPITFELVLVGRAKDFLPYFLVAFRELGERGIGAGRGRFDIDRVESLDAEGGASIVYEKKDSLVRVPESAVRFEDICGMHPEGEEIRVRFLTPVLIKQDGKWVRPTFGPLLRRLRDRINALAYFYCGETMDMDFAAFGRAADQIRCVHEDLKWVEESRYSKHRDLDHTLKGFVGSLTFAGGLGPFLPFLEMGRYVHVGKAAAFGQGWYRIEAVGNGESW